MPGRAKILTSKEIADIFSLLRTNRNRAMFALGIYTGLRIGELITLKCDQVYTKDGGVRNLVSVRCLACKLTGVEDPSCKSRGWPWTQKLRKKLAPHDDLAQARGATIFAGIIIDQRLRKMIMLF